MAFNTAPVTSISDLVDSLDTWMASNGWTNDHKDLLLTAGTGGEWAMHRTSGATNIRFSASWDAENTGTNLALYQYSDQAYVIGDRPWGQDHDSGNGFFGTTPDSSVILARHVPIGSAPQRYWAFEDDDYTHVVVRTADGTYVHFGWGMLDKLGGDWVGGEYCYGQYNIDRAVTSSLPFADGWSILLDGLTNDDDTGSGGLTNGMELVAGTIHAETMPGMSANQMWCVSVGGKRTAGGTPQTDFGTDRQSNDGASADEDREMMTYGYRAGLFANLSYRFQGAAITGYTAIWPVGVTYVDPNGLDIHGTPLGRMKGIGGINIENYAPEQEIILAGGSETWQVFPAFKKHDGIVTNPSGFLGIAYKKVS